MATKSAVLDPLISEFPGTEQSNPVENAEFIRFTVQLRVDQSGHAGPPEVFILFGQSEFQQASSTPGELERLFRERITQASFTDQLTGKSVRRSLKKVGGTWGAIDVNGQTWRGGDESQGYWIKGGA
jgi:hypothetical protein